MDFFEVVKSRRSVRMYRPDAVPRELLDKMFEAASCAPSAMNEQPWRYYVATGESRRRLGEIMVQGTHYLEEYMAVIGHDLDDQLLHWYTELGGAPVVIAATMPRVDDEFMRLNKHLSVGASIQNLLLAARDLGLGACNLTFSYWVSDEIAKLLGVPEDRVIIALISVGYPADGPVAVAEREHDIACYLD